MFQNIFPVPTFLFGVIAFLIAWQLARGINGVRAGQIGALISPVGFVAFVAMVFLLGFGVDSLLPPYVTFETWLVVAIVFVIVFILNLVVLPLLQRRWSPLFVRYMSYALTFFLIGAFMGWMVWSTTTARIARISEMLVPVVVIVLGVVIGAVGIVQSARGKI